VGDGIAIPHVRPAVALCFLEMPIQFGALDGKPVEILFVIVAPTSRTHLRLLSRLSAALHDPGFREVLKRRGSPHEIAAVLRRIEAGFPAEATPASR